MNNSKKPRLIVITGASVGLGRATAQAFARSDGARIGLIARGKDGLQGAKGDVESLFVEQATPCLIWWNFAHLFAVSLVPVSTAWVAVTRFAAAPVAVYAAVFVMVNSAYVAFVWEVLAQAEVQKKVSPRMRQVTRVRSVVTLGIFAIAMVLSVKFPLWGFALVPCVLFAYLRPEDSAEHS